MPVPRCTPEYHGMNSSIYRRTLLKVGVLAALSRKTYRRSDPSNDGTIVSMPTMSLRRSASVSNVVVSEFIVQFLKVKNHTGSPWMKARNIHAPKNNVEAIEFAPSVLRFAWK
jgi:hypothetical protein